MVEWLRLIAKPSRLPAAWLLDLDEAKLRRAVLALSPTAHDLARAQSRPAAERESVLARRGAVRLCVGAALGVPAEEVAVGWSATGAPWLTGPLSAYRLSFAQRLSRFGCALASMP